MLWPGVSFPTLHRLQMTGSRQTTRTIRLTAADPQAIVGATSDRSKESKWGEGLCNYPNTEYAELFHQSSELWLPHPLSRRRVCPPPFSPGGGAHSLAREGLGEYFVYLTNQQRKAPLSFVLFGSPSPQFQQSAGATHPTLVLCLVIFPRLTWAVMFTFLTKWGKQTGHELWIQHGILRHI